MKPLVFLAIALAVSIIGSLLVVLRNRNPTSPYGELDDFATRMQALAPRDVEGDPFIEPIEDRPR